VDAPVEAVIWDYGGVISSPLFRGIGRFETDMGYPPGSILELIFGDRSLSQAPAPAPAVGEAAASAGETAYIGAEGNRDGGDAIDGAVPEGASAVTHDWHRLEVGEIGFEEYIAGVVQRAPEVIGREIDLDAYQQFTRDMPLGIHWPVVHRIRRLRGDGLKVGLLTNNVKEFGSAWRATFPVDDLFDVVVDSSEVGLRKPDPRIYLLTCERLGVLPAASVFVDDNRDNVEAARAVGIEAVHFGDEPLTAIADLDAILDRRGTRSA
jgi:epoxide hydrolase-like predicted phosphatase